MPAIVINEWIFHDIRGDNGVPAQVRVEAFLEALKNGADHIVVVSGSRWTSKAWDLWKEHDTNIQLLSKLLYLSILVDARRCRYLRPDEVHPLPPDLASQVPDDDAYLFQAAVSAGAAVIVTTDERLIATVTNAHLHNIKMRQRDEFVMEYVDLQARPLLGEGDL